eukprot:gnl/Chilomastix_cuspidata/944.p1 GENE.gnl/Chilomastix_cuspidata/944~~gnl/Chilomastix_cuspidata/944.p1  ORF type:complete len:556 (-),score=235.01 gnl/Chilomastix_cuspidata/944:133-1566(-)
MHESLSTGITPFLGKMSIRQDIPVPQTPAPPAQPTVSRISSPDLNKFANNFPVGLGFTPCLNCSDGVAALPKAKRDPAHELEDLKLLSAAEELLVISGFTHFVLSLFQHDMKRVSNRQAARLFKQTNYRNCQRYVLFTAAMFVRRFYLSESVTGKNITNLFCAALLLASKVEENKINLTEFARQFGIEDVRIVNELELILLRRMKFHLTVHCPFAYAEGAVFRVHRALSSTEHADGTATRLINEIVHGALGLTGHELQLRAHKPGSPDSQLKRLVQALWAETERFLDWSLMTDIHLLLSPRDVLAMCFAEALLSVLAARAKALPARRDVYAAFLCFVHDTPAPDTEQAERLVAQLPALRFPTLLSPTCGENCVLHDTAPLGGLVMATEAKAERFRREFGPASAAPLPALGELFANLRRAYEAVNPVYTQCSNPLGNPGSGVHRVTSRVAFIKKSREREQKHRRKTEEEERRREDLFK